MTREEENAHWKAQSLRALASLAERIESGQVLVRQIDLHNLISDLDLENPFAARLIVGQKLTFSLEPVPSGNLYSLPL